MKTGKILTACLVAGAGIGGQAEAASLLHSQVTGLAGSPVIVSLQFNDDDQATVTSNGAGPTAPAPVLDGLGTPTGAVVVTELIETGDSIDGLIDFPTFDVTGFGTGLAFAGGYEVTGTYSFDVGAVDYIAGTAALTGTISIYEDIADDADFPSGTGFGDGDLLGSFSVVGTLSSSFPLAVTAAGLVPEGVVIPTTSVVVSGAHNGDGIFGDPSLFDAIGLGTFNYKLSGPASGYDFGSSGDFSVAVSVVPSPSAAACGLLGFVGLGMRRRRSAK